MVDGFVNVYYYWVKDMMLLPSNSVVKRDNTISFVTNLIENPHSLGYKFYSVTDTNKLSLHNIKNLTGSDIVLNVDIRTNDFDGDAHSVWRLAKEGDKDYRLF